MKHILRPYQRKAVDNILKAFEHHQGVFLVMPTGGGKTITFCNLVYEMQQIKPDYKAVLIAHRQELLKQISENLTRLEIGHGLIQAQNNTSPESAIQVCSIQTLVDRDLGFEPDLLIIDEAHRAVAQQYQDVIRCFPKAKRLCVSATPKRLDGKGFAKVASELVVGATVKELIADGHLVSPTIMQWRKKIHPGKTNYLIESLASLGKGRRGICFTKDLSESERYCSLLQREGYTVAILSHESPDRAEIVERFRQGDLEMVINTDILTEGFDLPELDLVVLTAETDSLTRYLQQVGRVMRPCANKRDPVIIDLGYNMWKHGEPTSDREWSLDGVKRRVIPNEELYSNGELENARRIYSNMLKKAEAFRRKADHAPWSSWARQNYAASAAMKMGVAEDLLVAALGWAPGKLKDRWYG